LELQGWVGAASTTTGRAGTARRLGPGKRDGEVYERNQCLKPLKVSGAGSNLVDTGRTATHTRMWVTPKPDVVAGGEATVKVYGVAVARLQGNSWASIPSTGYVVNVGTVPRPPFLSVSQAGSGKAHRLLMVAEWDGVSVVVRGRESRPHGEGRQWYRSSRTGRSGGRR